MKEKVKKAPDNDPTLILPIENLSDSDKSIIDTAKLKQELAMEKVKNAISQNENAQLSYNNIILHMAIKYGLSDGDIIDENGNIKRKGKDAH